MRAEAHFPLQSCLLLMRNEADVITHFLIKFDRSILLSHFLRVGLLMNMSLVSRFKVLFYTVPKHCLPEWMSYCGMSEQPAVRSPVL